MTCGARLGILDRAPTIYAYPDLKTLLERERGEGRKAPLPGSGGKRITERPGWPPRRVLT